jgi:hypothetical protein
VAKVCRPAGRRFVVGVTAPARATTRTPQALAAEEPEARGVRSPAAGRDRWDAKQVSRLLAD